MDNTQVIDKKIARVADILEQVQELNKMIELHKSNSTNSSMLSQYEYMRNEFVEELQMLLLQFQINLQAA